MGRLSVLAVVCLVAGVAPATFALAACPGENDDGKRLTVRGTLDYVGKESGGYGFGIKECAIYIESKGNDGGACKVGRKITATGKFYSCEADIMCDFELGDPDVMEGAKVSCQ